MAVIYVGGGSDTELNENRDKMVDSLNATRNALIDGVLPGGGVALAHSSKILGLLKLDNIEKQAGVNLLKDVLLKPLKNLLKYDLNQS